MRIFFRILSLAKPLTKNILIFFLLNIFLTILGLVNYTLLIPVLNIIFNTEYPPIYNFPDPFSYSFSGDGVVSFFSDIFNYSATVFGKFRTLVYVCTVVIVSVILSNILKFSSLVLVLNIRIRVVSFLRKMIYKTFLRQSLSFYQKGKTGNLLNIISNDVAEVENVSGKIFEIFLRDPYIIIFYFIALFYISPSLTLFTIFYFPIAGIALSRIVGKLRETSKKNQENLARILGIANETILGIKVIKAFSVQNFFMKKFEQINNDYNINSKKLNLKRDLASPLSESLGVVMLVVVIIYGGYLILNTDYALNGPQFIAYIAIYSQILPPVKNIVSSISSLQKGLVAAERIFNVIDIHQEETKDDGIHVKNIKNEIEFRNVSFSYEDGKTVLKNISFKLRIGQLVAIVGNSGSGKTTIMDLLLRFYEIQKGKILIDGVPIQNISYSSLRNLFGVVTQESILFNDTIEKNIAFGVPYPSVERIKQAAQIAYADDFINKNGHKFQTIVGDRGMKLSGGQKQRITIARAIYDNPSVLLLDEATSSLDTESERMVQTTLNNVMKNRTSLVIAHRLSTIRKADVIIVLHSGKIVEQGTHQELMKKKNVYSEMIHVQQIK